jgi:hypothetical protein
LSSTSAVRSESTIYRFHQRRLLATGSRSLLAPKLTMTLSQMG